MATGQALMLNKKNSKTDEALKCIPRSVSFIEQEKHFPSCYHGQDHENYCSTNDGRLSYTVS